MRSLNGNKTYTPAYSRSNRSGVLYLAPERVRGDDHSLWTATLHGGPGYGR